MQCRDEPEFYRARMKAARRILRGEPRSHELPSQSEIREHLQAISERADRDTTSGEPAPRSDYSPPPEDCFLAFHCMLLPLEDVEQSPRTHPEGDALYHSLQVFALAREARPYDEEFLLAALLHDVGKAVDRREHTAASLVMLEGLVTPRTAWLIEHHPAAHALREGTLGARHRRRLEESDDFEDLLLLAECDSAGREQGVDVPEVDEALAYIRGLEQHFGDGFL